MWLSGSVLYKRVQALENQLEVERERNRVREEALINRLLSRAGAFPITNEDITGEPVPAAPVPDPPGLDDVRETFLEWAASAGASEVEVARQWALHKDSYSGALQ